MRIKLELNVLIKHVIPNDWKASVTIPVFTKGSKSDLENYRGITLMNSTTKLFTKLILNQLLKHISPREEQQGFRKNRSTMDAIFIVRQIVEKAIEFNKPAYLCFVDLTKAFDRVRLQDVTNCLPNQERIRLTKQLLRTTEMRILELSTARPYETKSAVRTSGKKARFKT